MLQIYNKNGSRASKPGTVTARKTKSLLGRFLSFNPRARKERDFKEVEDQIYIIQNSKRSRTPIFPLSPLIHPLLIAEVFSSTPAETYRGPTIRLSTPSEMEMAGVPDRLIPCETSTPAVTAQSSRRTGPVFIREYKVSCTWINVVSRTVRTNEMLSCHTAAESSQMESRPVTESWTVSRKIFTAALLFFNKLTESRSEEILTESWTI